ncbi:MAG: hypothetical protein CM1200mP39_12990 [Dehalococcoidia bacterium]|nr:MAG: hypothetical protein CM1200mP39_12990 [Dehalococcoidia bacterium]
MTTEIKRKLNVEVNGITIECAAQARVLDAINEAGFDAPNTLLRRTYRTTRHMQDVPR